MQAKSAFLAKSGREKRNLERNKARFLTKEEVERLQELDNKRLVSVWDFYLYEVCLVRCVFVHCRNAHFIIAYL